MAATGRVSWIGHFSLQGYVPGPQQWIVFGNGCQQGFCVGMPRRCKKSTRICYLHDPAHVHDGHAMTDVSHNAQIVRDKDDGQT